MAPRRVNKHAFGLVDLSYLVYYRCFTAPCMDGSQEFLQYLERSIANDVESLTRALKCNGGFGIPPTQIIIAQDCPRDENWRLSVAPEYKATRAQRTRIPDVVFPFVLSHVVPKLVAERGYHHCAVFSAEADDVLAAAKSAILARASAMGFQPTFVILTADSDYCQLADAMTTIRTVQGLDVFSREVIKAAKAGALMPVDRAECARLLLKRKILAGDRSDNISAVCRLGNARLVLLSEDDATLLSVLDGDAGAKLKYELNRTLIDMAYVYTASPVADALQAAISSLLDGMLEKVGS